MADIDLGAGVGQGRSRERGKDGGGSDGEFQDGLPLRNVPGRCDGVAAESL